MGLSEERRIPAKTWVFLAVAIVVVGVVALFAFTETWPYMHEVIWQRSWKPVCPAPAGGLGFCQ